MSNTKEEQKILNQHIINLQSSDETKVLQSLAWVKNDGKAEVIPHLIELLMVTPSDLVREEVSSMLKTLKDTSSLPYIIEALKSPATQSIRGFLVSTIWESGFNAEEHLDFLVKLAIQSDYLTVLEVVTVIENLEAFYPEDEIQDMMYDIDDFINENPEDPKIDILWSLKEVLEERKD